MTWKAIGASVLGSSHEKLKTPCQDYFKIEQTADTHSETVCCFLSDGAGSAIEGGTGARLACENAVIFCKQNLETTQLTESFAYELCEHLNELLIKEARAIGLPPRELSCTFLGLIIYRGKVLFIQLGDGAIVARYTFDLPNYAIVFWPNNGEYVNATYFLTDRDYYKHLAVSIKEAIPSAFALFTDGLQHLSLENESQTVHSPFFDPMFLALRKASSEKDILILNEKLRSYLNSATINERTDDDKTLVLISNEYDE